MLQERKLANYDWRNDSQESEKKVRYHNAANEAARIDKRRHFAVYITDASDTIIWFELIELPKRRRLTTALSHVRIPDDIVTLKKCIHVKELSADEVAQLTTTDSL